MLLQIAPSRESSPDQDPEISRLEARVEDCWQNYVQAVNELNALRDSQGQGRVGGAFLLARKSATPSPEQAAPRSSPTPSDNLDLEVDLEDALYKEMCEPEIGYEK